MTPTNKPRQTPAERIEEIQKRVALALSDPVRIVDPTLASIVLHDDIPYLLERVARLEEAARGVMGSWYNAAPLNDMNVKIDALRLAIQPPGDDDGA